MLNNDVKAGIIRVGNDDNLIVTEVINSKVKKRPKVENDKYKVSFEIDITCIESELGKNIKFDTAENVEQSQKRVADKLKEEVEEFVNLSKTKYNCDLMGFGSTFYKYKNKEYKKLIEKYGKDEYFKYIDADVKVKVKFPNEGGTYNIW